MSLIFKNILLNVFYYGITAVILPWAILHLEAICGVTRQPSAIVRAGALLLGLAGAVLQIWCIVVFHLSGKGTPSPAFAPKNLVIEGPYKLVRNPMNIGELMLFIALSGWFASPSLLAYTVLAALAFHGFIVLWEEPQNQKRFGNEYVRYKKSVNRWIPRLRAVSNGSGVEPSAVYDR